VGRSRLKKVFSPELGVEPSSQILDPPRRTCGLVLGLALISTENPNFEIASKHPARTAATAIRQWLFLLLGLALLLFLSACAATPKPAPAVPEAPATVPPGAEYRWWHARFHITWPADAAPRWYVDPLIANEVVGPVLRRHPSEIPLWRFHRRSVRDDAGHRFSWIFYAPASQAAVYYDEISENKILKQLVADAVVSRVNLEAVSDAPPQPVGATSDPRWSEVMKNAWPYYIHGISRMWLDMIAATDAAMTPKPDPDNVTALVERYRKIEDDIGGVWQTDGRHALLHHLNAIFSYQPLEFVEKRRMRF